MFRTILFTVFVASATAFSPNAAISTRPSTTSLSMAEGYSHGKDNGPKTKHDMENTSSTDDQDVNTEVNSPQNAAEKVKKAAEDVIDDVKDAVQGD